MKEIIKHNSDFLFIYEAAQCNPNGDPDQENKPRMDYDTNTNLVTDVRVKRYIRDYFKQQGQEIFVDMESDAKVKMDVRLKNVLTRLFEDDAKVERLLDNPELFKQYQSLKGSDLEEMVKKFVNKKPENKSLNIALLSGLIREQFSDIRMFGSAFAVDGFNRAMTGPIQLNWGYSLNEVFLIDSNTISSIMNDDSSTFGKDYRVKYSLLAFHGTINRHAAKTTGLTQEDVNLFREAIWNSISASPTRSKLNQYPKLYLEIAYNDEFHNGYFGDLRNLIDVKVKDDKDPRTVRGLNDLELNFDRLVGLLEENKSEGKAIKSVFSQSSPDFLFNYEDA